MRTIIHLDLDAFFCAVEEQRDPALRGKAFAVGGRAEGRGVVSSCSYAARQFGVRSAMPMARAVALCSGLIVVPPNFDAYREASAKVMARLHAFTPLVEQISIDEAFLDVSALGDSGETLARRLQTQIATELDLACSLGVASNKLVAKIATDFGKSAVHEQAKSEERKAKSEQHLTHSAFSVQRSAFPFTSPAAICIVAPGEEAAFLAPLPAGAMWGVGLKTAERLAALGLRTIGDIAAWPEFELTRFFGKHGSDLWRHANGFDERPIVTEHEAKSISQETTFERDVRDAGLLQQTLREQAEAIARKLRRKHLSGTTVKLKIRWPDFTTPTRQLTLAAPTDQAEEIYTAAVRLFEQTWDDQPVRLIGVGVSGLGTQPRQLSLWDAPSINSEQQRRIKTALDTVRARLGTNAVRRASELDQARSEE